MSKRLTYSQTLQARLSKTLKNSTEWSTVTKRTVNKPRSVHDIQPDLLIDFDTNIDIEEGPRPRGEKPVRPSAGSTYLMNGEYFKDEDFPADKGFWGGACNRGQCLRPNAMWYNFGSHAYYCGPCAHYLSSDVFNRREAERTWGPGKRLCEFQPTEERLPRREWLAHG